MCHIELEDPQFFALLSQIDEEVALRAQAQGCPCGGVLHQAHYPRKPRGCSSEAREHCSLRFSYCCSVCRKRTTPASVRFLGCFVYLSVVVVLSSARRAGLSSSEQRWCQHLSINHRTLRRWQQWWRERFVRTPFWQARCARFMPSVDALALPTSLLQRFAHADCALLSFLRFLAPLGRAAHAL